MGELSFDRIVGGGIKYATGQVVGSNTRTFSVSGLSFQPTHFLIVAGTIQSQSSAVAVLSSDAATYGGIQQALSWYSTYGGGRGFTKTITSDGFEVTMEADNFKSSITYTWYAWTD